jgi:ribosomal protein S27E
MGTQNHRESPKKKYKPVQIVKCNECSNTWIEEKSGIEEVRCPKCGKNSSLSIKY